MTTFIYYESIKEMYKSNKSSHTVYCIMNNICFATNLLTKETSTSFNNLILPSNILLKISLEHYEQLLVKHKCI